MANFFSKHKDGIVVIEEASNFLLIISLLYKIQGRKILFLGPCHIKKSLLSRFLNYFISAECISSSDISSHFDYLEHYKVIDSISNAILDSKSANLVLTICSDLIDGRLENLELKIRNCLYCHFRRELQTLAKLIIINNSISEKYSQPSKIIIKSNMTVVLALLHKQLGHELCLKILLLPSVCIKLLFSLVTFSCKVINRKLLSINKYFGENITINTFDFNKKKESVVMFLQHQGLTYGDLFEKDYYFSEEPDSPFNKKNMVFVEYENNLDTVNSPVDDIAKANYPFKALLLKLIRIDIKSLILCLSPQTFFIIIIALKSVLIIKMYILFLKFYSKLKYMLIGFDILCPSELIIAAQIKRIRCIGVQERLNTAYARIYPIILDDYFIIGEDTKKYISKNVNSCVTRMPIIGPVRSSWLNRRSQNPNSLKSQMNVVVLDCISFQNDYRPDLVSMNSWENNKLFLEDILETAKQLPNCNFIIRGKDVVWMEIPFFRNVVEKIEISENIIINSSYKELKISYDLIDNSDLVICRHTSLADETLAIGIPTLFYERTVNGNIWMRSCIDYNNYPGFVYDSESMVKIIKSIVLQNSDELNRSISEIMVSHLGYDFSASPIDKLRSNLRNILGNKV
jgi:hypothetical protein